MTAPFDAGGAAFGFGDVGDVVWGGAPTGGVMVVMGRRMTPRGGMETGCKSLGSITFGGAGGGA